MPDWENYDSYVFSRRTFAEFIGITALLCFVISYLFFNRLLYGLLLYLPAVILCGKWYRRKKIEARKGTFKKEFLKGVYLLRDYLRSGYSVENSILRSQHELVLLFGEESDLVREWQRASKEIALSKTPEEIFHDIGERTGIPEVQDFAGQFAAVKRTGGQIGEVITATARILSGKFTTEEQVKTGLAAKRLESRIMMAMPAAILLYVKMASPDLLSPLYETAAGRVCMIAMLFLYAAAVWWAERILRIPI